MASVATVGFAGSVLRSSLRDLAGASLTRLPLAHGAAPGVVRAETLWQERPAVVLVLRRPG